ncbi:OPT oligopeptide transporter protein-domain-containing protein [Lipomyces japonicus]|uniref:OPT oligopeptide transporter protein-domain-containing protein n=1 Tax=Lipomyces japonicus TaxID=56871 RepID=UPI0034CFE5A7
MAFDEIYNEKKVATTVDVKEASYIDYEDAAEREKIIQRIKVMNNVGQSTDIDLLADAASAFLYEKVVIMKIENALDILTKARENHYDDMNFPTDLLRKIELLIAGPEAYGEDIDTYELDMKLEAAVIKYHSPYPEVRAVTDPFDDTTVPVETIRAYFLGCVWVAIGAFVNEFFYERQPRLNLQSTVIQLFLLPCGKILQYCLPDWGFTFRGTRHTLNPGPWTHKEQMFATVMVNVGSAMSNFMSFTVAMRHERFFHLKWVNFGFIFLMNFSSLFFGYGLAGLVRKIVIFPVKAMFPTVLPTLALNRALLLTETKTSINGWTISRQKFFFTTFVISFIYFFFPSFIFKALSTFNWMTWIAPSNVKLALVTGSFLGMGVNPIPTFDWAVINYGSCLVVPFFSFMNKFIGVLLSGFVVMAIYWTNHKYTAFLPINANTIYDNTGATYNLSKILTNGQFDEHSYLNYSAPYMTAGHIVGTGGLWALYTCAFMYVLITEHKLLAFSMKVFYRGIRHPFRKAFDEFDDPHSQMMSKYPEVPDWWFLTIFIIGMTTGLIALLAWHTTVPIWTVIMIFLFNIAMYIPTVIIFATTGYQMGFGAFSVILAGYMDPGNAVTNMMIRMWGWNIDEQAESFIGDQKIAHYAKLPQRSVFRGQMLATLIQCFVTIGAVDALFNSVKDFCSPTQADKFVCQFPRTVYSDAIMFGIINPDRVLTTLYPALKHCFYIGPLIAIPFGILKLKYPSNMKSIHPALIVSGAAFWGATYNYTYYTGGFYMAFAFMFYVRRYYTSWWTKYNYILASGFSAGVAFAGIVIFLGLQYTQTDFKWWGNTIYAKGVDYARTASLKHIPPEGFGLQVGQFH